MQALEGSLRLTKGVKSATVNFPGKYAVIAFDENTISAQGVANAMSGTAHMMGKGMQYGGTLLLRVPGVNEGPKATKAISALKEVEGVAKVNLYPKQQAVGIQFTGKGKATSKQLLDALSAAGLKGSQYTLSGAGGRTMNDGSDARPDHAGMAMGNGGMAGPGAMDHRMPCGCAMYGVASPYYASPTSWGYYGPGPYIGGGCGCGR